MSEEQVIFEIQNLSKSYGSFQAVDNVSLQIRKSDRLAIIGPNGAGKSTFIDMISGATQVSHGKILYLHKNINDVPPNVRSQLGISRTFQITSIFPFMTVQENIQICFCSKFGKTLNIFSNFKQHYKEEAKRILNLVDLFKFRFDPAKSLSHGNQRALELGMALTSEPKVLIMDEPTQGMSGPERIKILDLVKNISIDTGFALVFTEHNIDSVFSLAKQILVMHRGRILFIGTPEEVKANQIVRDVYLGNEVTGPVA